MKLDTPEKLYAHQLKDLWSAEHQILDALPKVISRVRDEQLKKALQEHLKETQGQVGRLKTIFEGLDFEPGGHKCVGMEGLIKEGSELMQEETEPRILDAALIAALQRVEHYEIAGYGTARTFAEKLGRKNDADLLAETLEEEGMADRTMTKLAERSINFEALVAAG